MVNPEDDPQKNSNLEVNDEQADPKEHKSHISSLLKTIGYACLVVALLICCSLVYYYSIHLPNKTALNEALKKAEEANKQALAAATAAQLAAQRSANAQHTEQVQQQAQSGQKPDQQAEQAPPPPPPSTAAQPSVQTAVQNIIEQGQTNQANAAAATTATQTQTQSQVAANQAAATQAAQDAAIATKKASIAAAINATQASTTAAQASIDAIHTAYQALTMQLTASYQYVGACTYAVFANCTPNSPINTLATCYTLLTPAQQTSATNGGMQNPLMANLLTQDDTIETSIINMEKLMSDINGYLAENKTTKNEDTAHSNSTSAQTATQQISTMLQSTVKQINILTGLITPAVTAAVAAVITNNAATLNPTPDNTTAAAKAAATQSELLTAQQKTIAAGNTAATNAANAAANAAAAAAAEHLARVAAQSAASALAVAQATQAANIAAISTAIQNIQLAITGVKTAINSSQTQFDTAQTAIRGSATYLGICGIPSMAQYPYSITNAIALSNNNTTSAFINAFNNLTLNQQKQATQIGNNHPFIPQVTASLGAVQTQLTALQNTLILLQGYLSDAQVANVTVAQAQKAANDATVASSTAAAATATITSALNAVNTSLQNSIPVFAVNIQTYLTTFSGPFQVLYYADDYMTIYQNGYLAANNNNLGGCAGVVIYDLDKVTSGDVITFMLQNIGGPGGLAAQWQWGPNWRTNTPNTTPIVSTQDLYIASPNLFSGANGSVTKWILTSATQQLGMPPTKYNPGITAPENLSTLSANFVPTQAVLANSLQGWTGICSGPDNSFKSTLTQGGIITEQGGCQTCYIAFNWNVPYLPLDPAIPISTVYSKVTAYISTLAQANIPPDVSIVTAPYSGTFGADDALFVYRNGQIIYNNAARMEQYNSLAGVAQSGDVIDFVVQNWSGPGALIGLLSWNGNTYYTGIGGPNDLFNASPYTATIATSATSRQWPPYEQLVTLYATSNNKIISASGLYGSGIGNWMSPFPGSDMIFDNQQLPKCYVMFRWIVPKVTNPVIQPTTTYEAQPGALWTSMPGGIYKCPTATNVNITGDNGNYKNYCVFDKTTAKDDVRKWCDSDDNCGGYLQRSNPTQYVALPLDSRIIGNTAAAPNLYYKKNKKRTTGATTSFVQQSGSFWMSAAPNTYNCPNAAGRATDDAHKPYCAFTGANAQRDVEAWCNSDTDCLGYVYGLDAGSNYYIAGKAAPTASTSFPPNQYFKKTVTTSAFANSKKSGYFARAVK